MREINEIIVHCTATRSDWWAGRAMADKVQEVRRWHVDDNKWSDIGYHWLIDRDGSIMPGRPMARAGAHTKGRKKHTIGIALFGGHGSSERDSFTANFTQEQDASLRALIGDMKSRYGPLAVNGHNQFAKKACPGFDVPSWFDGAPLKRVASDVPKEAMAVIADAGKDTGKSTINWGALVGIAGSGWTAFKSADPTVQAAALGVVAVLAWIMRERIRKAKLGKLAQEALGL